MTFNTDREEPHLLRQAIPRDNNSTTTWFLLSRHGGLLCFGTPQTLTGPSTRRRSGNFEEWDVTHVCGPYDCVCGWNTPPKTIPLSSWGSLFLHRQTRNWKPGDTYIHQGSWSSSVQVVAYHLYSVKPLSKPMHQATLQTNADLLPIRSTWTRF